MKKIAELLSRRLEKDAIKSAKGDYTTNKVFIGKQELPSELLKKLGK
ncbi:hypothetical protein [Paenibacillus wenxiniae]|uniref:Uncharacterized protein n=1 Tax=Paenibacillus wenxiniae TaxID=1636843 RepID=A0ABW4RIR0_9BACL